VPRSGSSVRHDLDALRALYAEADAALAGWSCEGSTDCCHFGRTGREPYLWPNEWALLERAIGARGGVKAAAPGARDPRAARSLPIADEGRCPLLGSDGRCTVYADRPFGCRTFYCDRAEGPTRKPPRAALADVGRRVAALAHAVEPGGDGPRQLTRLVGQRARR
jgi:Fe-S-cluster containining protein